jgi:hypothetical protein
MCRLGERVGMNEEKNAMSLGFWSQYVYNYALKKKNFLLYKKIQKGLVAKTYMSKGLPNI